MIEISKYSDFKAQSYIKDDIEVKLMSHVAHSQVVIEASSVEYFPVQTAKGCVGPLHIGDDLS